MAGGPPITPDERALAKRVTYGIIYGQTAFGLKAGLAVSQTEARDLITDFLVSFSGVPTPLFRPANLFSVHMHFFQGKGKKRKRQKEGGETQKRKQPKKEKKKKKKRRKNRKKE